METESPMSASRHPIEWTLTDLTRVSSSKLPLREILRHDDGCPFGRWILLYWGEGPGDAPFWIDFEVIEGVGCLVEKDARMLHVGGAGAAGTGPVMFFATEDRQMFGLVGVNTTTTDLNQAVWSVRGFVKRVGCTQVYFPDGPLHYDGQAELCGMFGAICRAQGRCYEIYAEAESYCDADRVLGIL